LIEDSGGPEHWSEDLEEEEGAAGWRSLLKYGVRGGGRREGETEGGFEGKGRESVGSK